MSRAAQAIMSHPDATREPDPLWLVDWSDEEDEQFRTAWRAAGVSARVLRARPLGSTTGTALHRLRSWPTYLWLAQRALRDDAGGPIVAWQPLAGAVTGLLRSRRLRRLLILNPILERRTTTWRQRAVLVGLRQADTVMLYSRRALDAVATLGLDRAQLRYVPLGVVPRRDRAGVPGSYFLAAGRDYRDWETLAEAVAPLRLDVRVAGPRALGNPGRLRLVSPGNHRAFLDLLEGAAALIVPLLGSDRQAGQLAVLDALSLGRAVIATRGMGTEDYVTSETGVLVPPRDPAALRRAIVALSEPRVAQRMGAAALAAARTTYSLERFVREVDVEARAR
jgi:glycosyltransferase involved in cell wall biosynthesis